MASVQVLTEEEKEEIEERLEKYANINDDGNLMSYLFEKDVSDGEVEIRFFLTPEQGPPEGIFFEIIIDDNTPWHEKMGSYSADNLRNGGPHYVALADELETIVQRVTGQSANFVIDKGGGAFTEEISL